MYGERLARVRAAMAEHGVDVLLLSLGADLPWLTGYTAMPLERLTMLVLPAKGPEPLLVVPQLEAPRVAAVPGVFDLRPWGEQESPVEIVADFVREASRGEPLCGIGERTWSGFLLRLQASLPKARWQTASPVIAPLRAVKSAAEVEALARASEAADEVATALLAGEVQLVGRTERQVSAELRLRLLEAGHEHVDFAIVASGPSSASPHHEPGERVIGLGEPVVCDFGGTLGGYCSDTTRTVFTGPPPAELGRIYEIVAEAQAAGVAAASQLGAPCSEVDAAARDVIVRKGYGQYFIHRTGHGIGLETHEDPYMVAGNSTPLVAGHAFSVEPGIYLPGRFGVRIEDIVVATEAGPRRLNRSSHTLTIAGG